MRVITGAEGGTRQANEKDSNQLAVLLDKLKEQGSYGDPVSGTLTRCAVYPFLAHLAPISKGQYASRLPNPIYESCQTYPRQLCYTSVPAAYASFLASVDNVGLYSLQKLLAYSLLKIMYAMHV